MIALNGGIFEQMMMNGEMVSEMWLNGHIIWQGIRSCYGGGMWLNEKPYLNTDGWKN